MLGCLSYGEGRPLYIGGILSGGNYLRGIAVILRRLALAGFAVFLLQSLYYRSGVPSGLYPHFIKRFIGPFNNME